MAAGKAAGPCQATKGKALLQMSSSVRSAACLSVLLSWLNAKHVVVSNQLCFRSHWQPLHTLQTADTTPQLHLQQLTVMLP